MMYRARYRCGAPSKTRDKRKPWSTCHKFVAVEGTRCHLHREQKEATDG